MSANTAGKEIVRVTATFDIDVQSKTANRWRSEPGALEHYVRTACFRNHDRIFVGVRTDLYGTPPAAGGETRPQAVPARVYSDDRMYEVPFDAERWLRNASDAEIVALHECEWGGDEPADAVALDAAGTNRSIEVLLDYCRCTHGRSSDPVGFECHVDRDAALRWLADHRPALHAQLTVDA